MKLLIIGDETRRTELISGLQTAIKQHAISHLHELNPDEHPDYVYDYYDVIIDISFDQHPIRREQYAHLLPHKIVLLGAAYTQLAKEFGQHLFAKTPVCNIIGFNNLPTFMHKTLWEVTTLNNKTDAEQLFEKWGVTPAWVADRVGMVTPRIIAMIINEACFTLQEGTATIADIDKGMKLGTNYPYGPFEWADKIGINYVYELLTAVYNDTHNERYRICPLLQTYYYQNKKFTDI